MQATNTDAPKEAVEAKSSSAGLAAEALHDALMAVKHIDTAA